MTFLGHYRRLLMFGWFTLVLPVALFAGPPHIVYIIADDLGWNDVGYHGSTIKTPHIDALARGGVRLEQFYVQPVCSPTRAAFLTGRYPVRTGLQVGVIRPWADYGLPLDEITLPQVLQRAGYRTAICGKWHLGAHAPEFLPTRRGFDLQYGHYCGAIDYFKKNRDGGHDWHRNDAAVYEEGYSTHLLGNEAAKIVREHDPSRPLFLYVPFNAVHSPLQVPDEYLPPTADKLDNKRRIFTGMTVCMDEAIGKIVAALEETGLRKNTLIVFHSDNGGPEGLGADNGPLRGQKGTLYEGGVRVTALANFPGVIPADSVCNEPLHVVDMFPTLVKLSGQAYESAKPLDGLDIWPVLTAGESLYTREILLNATPTEGAIRKGDWKLIVRFAADNRRNRRQNAAPVELFDLSADLAEATNLADRQPKRVADMRESLERFRAEAIPPRNKPQAEDFRVPKVWGEPDRP